jgi:mannose-6-phosphate isomerase-like protein (cupin superfamily)
VIRPCATRQRLFAEPLVSIKTMSTLESTSIGEVISRENAPHYTWGAMCDGWRLLDRSELSVIHERVPPGAGEVEHLHHKARQFFWILSGEATLESPTRAVSLKAGQGVEVPANVKHRFVNHGTTEVHFLVISAPSTRGDRVNSP